MARGVLGIAGVEEEDASNFILYASPYTGVAVGGSGLVNGTLAPEIIFIRDVAGTVHFDPSFNRGGDEIFLPGNAEDWTARLGGSNALLSDGDTTVIIPIGSEGLALGFSDGVRFLRGEGNVATIGDQVLDSTPQPVLAEPVEFYLGIDTPQFGPSFLYVSPGDPVTVYSATAPISISGTNGAEHVMLMGGRAVLDGSFNRGNDIVTLQRPVEEWTAEREGAHVVLRLTSLGRFAEIWIPVGTDGMELRFEEESRTLIYDKGSQQVMIGDQVIQAEATALFAFG